jgi:hypothetical protein
MRRGPLYAPGTVTLAQKPQLLPALISPIASASASLKTISLPAALQAMWTGAPLESAASCEWQVTAHGPSWVGKVSRTRSSHSPSGELL